MAVEFIPSNPSTVGVELELQLIDRESRDLVDGIMPLIEFYPGSPYVKPEFIQNTVEITTRVCQTIAEAHDHLHRIAAGLMESCEKLEMQVCGAGTHPFCERLALITPFPRYRQMVGKAGYLGQNQITYSTHVHVGMTSGEQAIRTMRRLKPYLPLLIALSASSPLWRGHDTGFVSYRQRILAAARSYGIPPSFDSWHRFTDFFEASTRAGIFKTINDIHWDIRPRPHLGTLEIRVMDAQATLAETMDLAGLVRTLVVFLRDGDEEDSLLPHALPWWIEKDNHYQASNLGLAAKYVCTREGEVRPLVDICEHVIDTLESTATALGEESCLYQIRRRLREKTLGYMRQRDLLSQTGSFRKVVASLVDELAREIDRYQPGAEIPNDSTGS